MNPSARRTELAFLAAVLVGAFAIVVTAEWIQDLIRAAILAQSALIYVIAGLIVHRYSLNYRADKTRARLLPHHVVMLGAFSLLTVFSMDARIVSGVGNQVAWFGTPLFLPATTALLAGLVDLLLWMPHRGGAAVSNHNRRRDDPPTVPPRLR